MLNPVAPFRAAMRERNVRLLLTALATSQAGDWLYNLALLAFVYDRTRSSVWLGFTTAARILPEVGLGPLGGILTDRLDRRRLMLASDAARATAMGALALIAVAHAPIIFAPALAALCTAAGAAYPPCVLAVLPRLASDEQLPAANAARVSITYICVIAGPLFGAVLLLLGSPAIAFVVNGATFLIGGAVVAALPRDALRLPPTAPFESPAGLRHELRTGWLALRGSGDALTIVGANVVASAIYGALTVLFVILGRRLGLGAAGYGYLIAAIGAGGLLAAGVANRAAESARPRKALIAAVAAVGAPLPLLAIAGWLPAAIVLAAVFGGGSVVAEVVGDTCLQRSLDPAVFARAYGLALPACLGGIAAGALVAPLGVTVLGANGTLVLLGAAVIAYGGLLLDRPRRLQRPPALAGTD
jgi:MFS family permease